MLEHFEIDIIIMHDDIKPKRNELQYHSKKKGSKGVLKLSSQENPQRFNKKLKKVLYKQPKMVAKRNTEPSIKNLVWFFKCIEP